ncbi:hypothetical protein Ahy_B10g102264 [Arachis hypogaea]|uniref:Uncharacterized protein n=1 Tax=Arachis hypogaea TaxID=3818 RepID=A0A444X1T5_ARAHY|nr:hypothetical protein Ahy_B10g102264 [Arachis hypogaea]
MKDVGLWTISKVVLNHSHPCCPDQAKMLKQHMELSMFKLERFSYKVWSRRKRVAFNMHCFRFTRPYSFSLVCRAIR